MGKAKDRGEDDEEGYAGQQRNPPLKTRPSSKQILPTLQEGFATGPEIGLNSHRLKAFFL